MLTENLTTNRILKIKEVTEICALSRSSIYDLIQKGKFPRQVKLSARSSGWLASEIYQWIQDQAENR